MNNSDQFDNPEHDRMFWRWVSSELERMDYEEQLRTRHDHCPYCGAYWEDGCYEDCPVLPVNQSRK